MAFRGRFRVDEPRGQRWALALEQLATGDPVVIRGVSLWLDQPGVVRVEAASAWSDPSQVTEEVARRELARAQANVEELLGDPAFKQLVADRELRYELVNDYETGSILLCTLRNGGLDWAATGCS
jgi:hypothetical protein